METMEKAADYFVARIKAASGKTLDFSPSSLEFVDSFIEKYIKGRWKDSRYLGKDSESIAYTSAVNEIGSYLGEVLCRNLDAEWREYRGGYVVMIKNTFARCDVFDTALKCIRISPRLASTYEDMRRISKG